MSSNPFVAVLFPDPDMPVTTTMRARRGLRVSVIPASPPPPGSTVVPRVPRRGIPPARLAVHDRRGAEQIPDVDDSQPANLHVVPGHVVPGTQDGLRPPLFQVDDVVGDEPVPAEEQGQRTLALPSAALAHAGS